MRLVLTATVFLALTAFAPYVAFAIEDAESFFRKNCINCHTIGGGRLTGPDLKNVSERNSREYLSVFMQNPQAVIEGGDAYAVKLYEDARRVVMPTITGMDKEMADALLDLIEAESLLEESQFIGLTISDAPFSPEDIAKGLKYFRGGKRFENGAPSCISCHSTLGLGGLGGGGLGPDLTRVFERLEGRKNLASWLLSPPTETMQPVYVERPLKSEEILALVAFLEERAKLGGEGDEGGRITFLLLGLLGAFLGLATFDFIWNSRFRSVRSALVKGGPRTGGRSGNKERH